MAGSSTLLQHGPLSYDLIGRIARLNGERIELSGREISLLETFLQRAGRLVSKDQLVNHLCEWGEEVSAMQSKSTSIACGKNWNLPACTS
jgi:DNA-binding response OmpR family regulator